MNNEAFEIKKISKMSVDKEVYVKNSKVKRRKRGKNGFEAIVVASDQDLD